MPTVHQAIFRSLCIQKLIESLDHLYDTGIYDPPYAGNNSEFKCLVLEQLFNFSSWTWGAGSFFVFGGLSCVVREV